MSILRMAAVAAWLCVIGTAHAADRMTLIPELAFFEPLVEKTWRGVGIKDPTRVDITRWEVILGGRAIQHTHKNAGSNYGGRTLYFYDPKAEKIRYHYVSNAGFSTIGEGAVENGVLQTMSEIKGAEQVQKVKGTVSITSDGYEVRAMYYRDGEWIQGHANAYKKDPNAQIIFSSGGY